MVSEGRKFCNFWNRIKRRGFFLRWIKFVWKIIIERGKVWVTIGEENWWKFEKLKSQEKLKKTSENHENLWETLRITKNCREKCETINEEIMWNFPRTTEIHWELRWPDGNHGDLSIFPFEASHKRWGNPNYFIETPPSFHQTVFPPPSSHEIKRLAIAVGKMSKKLMNENPEKMETVHKRR